MRGPRLAFGLTVQPKRRMDQNDTIKWLRKQNQSSEEGGAVTQEVSSGQES